MKNPYDCSVCDNEDCSGCGESAYENGYIEGMKVVTDWIAEYVTNRSINPTIFPRTAYQQKLKEWCLKK